MTLVSVVCRPAGHKILKIGQCYSDKVHHIMSTPPGKADSNVMKTLKLVYAPIMIFFKMKNNKEIFLFNVFEFFLTVYVYSDSKIDQQCIETNLWNLNLLKFLVYL